MFLTVQQRESEHLCILKYFCPLKAGPLTIYMENNFQENVDFKIFNFQFILSFNEHAFTFNLVCFGLHIAENYFGSYNKEGKLAYLTEKLYILNRWLPMFSQGFSSFFCQSLSSVPQPSLTVSVLFWQ